MPRRTACFARCCREEGERSSMRHAAKPNSCVKSASPTRVGMRYAVPVNAADEVAELAGAGVDELYCGYQDSWWTRRYGDHDSASRRQGAANYRDMNELERTACLASRHGLPLWLALNSRYTEPQLDHLTELCGRFEQVGGTGVILSDLGLLWRLRKASGLRRCLSLLAVAQNVPTLRAYQSFGVTRVVLPRFVGPEEAAHLLGAVPGLEGESMAFFDKCPWVDGYCRHRHGVTYQPREVAGDVDDAPPIYTFDTTYRTHACLGRACDYLEPYPCAACHLGAFARAGVGIAKLGGRGRPLDERLRALRFLRAAEELPSDEDRRRLYERTFGRPCSCYYGEERQRRDSIEPVPDPDDAHGRMCLGSQTSVQAYRYDLAALLDAVRQRSCIEADRAQAKDVHTGSDTPLAGAKESCASLGETRVSLLVPPLSDVELATTLEVLPLVTARLSDGLCIYANDLGTYLSLASLQHELGFELRCGTLLARTDDPSEVSHFLAKEQNPPRAVWGPNADPRVLRYRHPTEELARHWASPSLLEPSAQAALHALSTMVAVP